MAKGTGRVRFFFQHAYSEVNTLIDFIRRRFENLYPSGGESNKGATEPNLSVHFQDHAEQRFIQNIRVAEYSKPLGIPFQALTVFEWHLIREEIERKNAPKGFD